MHKLFIFLFLIISVTNIFSQERTIYGKVTAFKTVPLNNIRVISKVSKNLATTDKAGKYVIKCTVDDVLTFESECFAKVKRKIKNERDTINVNLYFNSTGKNRELAVQSGYISKDSLDYALSNLPNLKEDYSIYSDIFSLLKAKYPYVQISGTKITIPPPAFGTGEVLMLVDGNQVSDISFVQTRNVISIQVIKGPETAMYGMKGANGVILIKTFGKE